MSFSPCWTQCSLYADTNEVLTKLLWKYPYKCIWSEPYKMMVYTHTGHVLRTHSIQRSTSTVKVVCTNSKGSQMGVPNACWFWIEPLHPHTSLSSYRLNLLPLLKTVCYGHCFYCMPVRMHRWLWLGKLKARFKAPGFNWCSVAYYFSHTHTTSWPQDYFHFLSAIFSIAPAVIVNMKYYTRRSAHVYQASRDGTFYSAVSVT